MHTSKGQFLEVLGRSDFITESRSGVINVKSIDKNKEKVYMVDYFDNCAHFVADEKITQLALSQEADKSFSAMAQAGICNLPFDPIMIEFALNEPNLGAKDSHCFVRLSSKPIKPLPKDEMEWSEEWNFNAYPMIWQKKRQIISLSNQYSMGVEMREDTLEAKGKPFVIHCGYRKKGDVVEALGLVTAIAVRIALLTLNTRGVSRETISMAKLDKQRSKQNKPRIGDYTILRIGHVYNRKDERIELTHSNRHMPIHWRTGHIRHMRYGQAKDADGNWIDKENRPSRPVFIPPCLVNYDPKEGGKDVKLPKKEIVKSE